uniref:Uncharacterized protein n=1 Tax=Santana virus TaxID=1170427 RepID=M1F385_9VIRU|nr:hypothetical protein 1 [Santana virus]
MADHDEAATRSLLFISEMAKHLEISTEDVRSELGSKLLSRSTAITSQYEDHVVSNVLERITNFKELSKEIYIDQRLSDAEKTKLMQLWSPPYKLKFSKNSKDIGAHMYYRSMNEIATYRCYDLICGKEKNAPVNRDVLVKEVGAAVCKIVKYNRNSVHACTPNLTIDDTLRISNTQRSLESIIHDPTSPPHLVEKAKRYQSSGKYRCFRKSQHCKISSKFLVLAHCAYDCTLRQIANMMESAGAVRGIGFIHFSQKILSNLVEGSDNGLNWKIECRTYIDSRRNFGELGNLAGHAVSLYNSFRNKSDRIMNNINHRDFVIKFWFDNDYQNSYVHDLDTYLGIIRKSVCEADNGQTFMIQRKEEIGGLLFFEIIRPTIDIPPCVIHRMLPFSEPEDIIIHYYRLQNDPQGYHYHDLVPERLVCPKKFFEKLYYYLFCLPEGKFTVQNAVIMASTMASRTVINGTSVSQPYNLSINVIDKVSHAAYFIVYCRRYDLMLTLKKLKNFEDIRRNPTMYNRLCVLLRRVRNYVVGAPFEDLKTESTFDDAVDNATCSEANEIATKHSLNIIQWMMKLFRVNNRYKVDFFPITRVVSIEEDIQTFKAVEFGLPKFDEPVDDDSLRKIIKEKLHIDHVDVDKCTVSDTPCKCDLVPYHNNYEKRCVLLCFCNKRNISLNELQLSLYKSKYFEALFSTTKTKYHESIFGDKADIILFELIACVYNVNICLHTELKEIFHDVRSDETYHFMIKDNHCYELREKPSVRPFEFLPVPDKVNLLQNNLREAYSRPKAEKYKLRSVVVDDHHPYVCRSALKLLEIDGSYGVVKHGNVCEISAAPGSWIQYCHINHSHSKLFYTYFIEGNDFLYDHEDLNCLCESTSGDVTSPEFFQCFTVEAEKSGRFDTLLSDAVIMSSTEDHVDVERFTNYQNAFFLNLKEWVRDNGNIVFKSFADISISDTVNTVLNHFENVYFVKPNFSAALSTEYYIIGKNFLPETADEIPERKFFSIPSLVMNKVLRTANLFLKGKYPPQKKFVLPAVNPSVTTFPDVPAPSAPVEIAEDLAVLPNENDSFEDKVQKVINSLEFFDVDRADIEIVHEDTESFHHVHDVEISLHDSAMLGERNDYIIHPCPALKIDMSVVNYSEAVARIHSVSYKINSFRLKVKFDLTGVSDETVSSSLLTHIKERYSRHKLLIRTNYRECSVNISAFEKSTTEYIAYTRLVKSCNLSTYRHWYGQLKMNDFVVSMTIRRNVSMDTQNISYMQGCDFRFKHEKSQDEYTHCYCGETDCFIPFDEKLPDRWYLVGDYTAKMFDDALVEKVARIDLSKLKDVQFVLVQGVAGHGKTHEIVSKHTPSLRSCRGDLLVTPTIAGKKVIMERTANLHKLEIDSLDISSYRTVTSFLVKPTVHKYNTVYFDEAIMVHVALVIAVAYYSGAKTVYMYGDVAQIPAHSRLGSFDFNYHAPQKLFNAQHIRNKSYRIPADVAAALNPVYVDCHSQFGQSTGITTVSTVARSLNVVLINDVSEMKRHYREGVKYLAFTHTTANELNRLSSEFSASTIAAFQGSESKEVAIVRTSVSEADQMYNNINLCVTALTRHTLKLTYYTCCHKGDFLKKTIESTKALSDLAIKNFSTSINAGSVTNNEYVPMIDKPSVSRFFKSREKYSHSFTIVEHENVVSEKEFAYKLSKINNDIFVRKSIFKKFSMSELAKWIRKISPHIKQVYVKVYNEPFENNPIIIDIAEEYKVRNALTTEVSEHLEPINEVELITPIPVYPCMQLKPCLETLREFMSSLYPDQMYVNTDFDAYFVHTNDIDYTLSDTTLSMLWDRPHVRKYDCLTPWLSTPAPARRDVSFREILLGLMKRNMNPPQMLENTAPDDAAMHLMQSISSKAFIRGWKSVISEMLPIVPTTESIVRWLEKQDRSVLKSMMHDIPLWIATITRCSLSLKRNPKVRITPNAISIYDSVQTITCHPKFLNAYFCPIIDEVMDRFRKVLLPWFLIYTKENTESFSVKCSRAYAKYGKLGLFAGDDSFLINGIKMKEADISKCDKSELLLALKFLCMLLENFGVPEPSVALYYCMMYYRICSDPSNKITVSFTPQMESGSPATFFGNTTYCMAVILSVVDFETFEYTPRFEKFSMMFNLEVKEFKYDNPYFCSKFIVIDDLRFKFLPDPVKILIKLGRKDLKNFSHLKEFHTSLKDLVAEYKCVMDISVVSLAVQERYGFPFDCSNFISNMIAVINDETSFNALFTALPGAILDLKATRFSED